MARPASERPERIRKTLAAFAATPQGPARARAGLRRLDAATILGLFGAFAFIAVAVALGGNPFAFLDLPSFFIVGGGTFTVTAMCFSLGEVAGAQRVILQTLVRRASEPEAAARDLLGAAEAAHRAGLLALERDLPRLAPEPFLAKGLQLVIDGTPAEEVERVLRRELHAIAARHARSAGVLRKAAEIAPAMGLIGTLIGLVQMLGHLDDPAAIGPGMAVALITTLYGALLATLVFSPLAAKLERNSIDEALVNHIFLLGCVSIGRQENPRRLEPQVNALLPPSRRIRYFP
ncbi:MAG: motility protein A [Pseudomonadota bacterium]